MAFFAVLLKLHGLSVKEFGAKGDGAADDTAALQQAFDAGCGGTVYFPAGTYNIRKPLVMKCALTVLGEGPARSTIFQTVHATLNSGINANFSLTLQDISIDTAPVHADKGMVAIFRKDEIAGALGQSFTFLRVHSSGFNFGIDIAGSSDTDILGPVIVRDCDLSVSTVPNAVSNPVNVRNGESLIVEDSTLTGDGNNDHAVYLISVRKVLLERNVIRNHGNSAIKLLTGGFRAALCPSLNDDYASWIVRGNTISDSKLALAAYTYCDVKLPLLSIENNAISNIANTYAGDAAAMYIQANCQSTMEEVRMSHNIFRDLGLGGVFLLSSIQGGAPCAHLTARGTIAAFTSDDDRFTHFSISYPGSYSAITANGPHVLRVSVSHLRADGQATGGAALNLGAVAQRNLTGIVETRLAGHDP